MLFTHLKPLIFTTTPFVMAFTSTDKMQHRGTNTSLNIDTGLGPLLSKSASISHNLSEAPRWSDFAAPTPGTVVNIATAEDVLLTVSLALR
jgi:hypothetical protein